MLTPREDQADIVAELSIPESTRSREDGFRRQFQSIKGTGRPVSEFLEELTFRSFYKMFQALPEGTVCRFDAQVPMKRPA